MADFTSVLTVELLTRAADAAGKAAEAAEGELITGSSWQRFLSAVGAHFLGREKSVRLMVASGPDHWRAVEATFRRALERTEQVAAIVGCTIEQAAATSVILPFLRPFAEQVLQHLGDTE